MLLPTYSAVVCGTIGDTKLKVKLRGPLLHRAWCSPGNGILGARPWQRRAVYALYYRYVRSPLGYFRRWIQGTLRVCGRLLSGVGLICMPLRSLADSFKDHHLDYTRVHCRISPERPYYLASVCLVAAACLVVYNSAKARPFSLAHTLYPHALHRDDRGPYVKIYILLTYTF